MNKNKLLENRKHRIGFLLSCFFTLLLSQYGVAQVSSYVDNISYQYTESYSMAFPNGTTFEDIHAYDMPSLEYKEMSYQMKKDLDENGNPQTLQTLVGAVNYHEDWQRLSERWLFNEKGTTLYGVKGKGRNKTYFVTDFFDHSRKSLELYENTKSEVLKFGYLTSSVFPSKIRDLLNEVNSQGGGNTQGGSINIQGNDIPFNVAPDGSLVASNNEGEYIVYQIIKDGNGTGVNTNSGTDTGTTDTGTTDTGTTDTGTTGIGPVGIVKQIKYQGDPDNPVFPVFPDENDPEVITMSIAVFDIDLCGELLKSSTTDVIKEVLFNGLCAKRITQNTYSKYEFECQETANRSSKDEKILLGDMALSPNPLRAEILNISLPISLDNEEMQIQIMSLSGQKIGELTKQVNGRILQLNIGDIISSQGLYIIAVQSPSYTSTKKIFYTLN